MGVSRYMCGSQIHYQGSLNGTNSQQWHKVAGYTPAPKQGRRQLKNMHSIIADTSSSGHITKSLITGKMCRLYVRNNSM